MVIGSPVCGLRPCRAARARGVTSRRRRRRGAAHARGEQRRCCRRPHRSGDRPEAVLPPQRQNHRVAAREHKPGERTDPAQPPDDRRRDRRRRRRRDRRRQTPQRLLLPLNASPGERAHHRTHRHRPHRDELKRGCDARRDPCAPEPRRVQPGGDSGLRPHPVCGALNVNRHDMRRGLDSEQKGTSTVQRIAWGPPGEPPPRENRAKTGRERRPGLNGPIGQTEAGTRAEASARGLRAPKVAAIPRHCDNQSAEQSTGRANALQGEPGHGIRRG